MIKFYFGRSADYRTGQHHPEHNSRRSRSRLGLVVALSALLLSVNPALATKTFLDFQTGSTSNPSPANWNFYTPSQVLNEATIPLFDELNNPTGVSFRFDLGPAFWASSTNVPVYSSFSPSGLDLSEFDDSISVETVGQRLEFTGLIPGETYDFWMLGWTYDESFSPPMDFSISGAGTWTYLDNPSDGYLAINGQYGTTSRTFDSYAMRFTADSTTLAFEAASGEDFSVYGVVLEQITSSPQQSAAILPVFDAAALWNGASFDVTDGENSIGAQYLDWADHDYRGIMEFSLDQIPDDAIITGATLTIDVSSVTYSTTYPRLRLLGYAGNGQLDVEDATAASLDNLVAVSDPVESPDPITINIDTEYLQSLIGQEDYLGLLGIGDDDGHSISWFTLESSIFGRGVPQLEITYTQQLAGDLNGDGFVGIADLDIVLGHWNQSVDAGDPLLGDPSGDGFVGIADLDLILGNWNAGTPPQANASDTIPEPGSLALVAAMTACLLRRMRRHG